MRDPNQLSTMTVTEAGARLTRALGYVDAVDALDDPRGNTVRCTPRRLTVLQEVAVGDAGGVQVFRKIRSGGVAAAEAEWRWLRELPRLGVSCAAPAYFARVGERTVVATFAAPGRPLTALLGAAGVVLATAYACGPVVTLVRRLHARGLVFRDLYWNHLFAADLDLDASPRFIDVERVLRPRVLWRRWVVKDLAGLVASWPLADSSLAPALVQAYRGRADERLVDRVERKAAQIRRHAPRYGA